jgi:hypothetical protein
MAVDIDLIRAYTDGGVYTTDAGATAVAPINASSALHVNFKALGAISDDGISESSEQDTTEIYIWQGATLARKIFGQYKKTYKFAAAELNLVTAGISWSGSTITQTAEGLTVAEKPPSTDIRQWVIHGIDGNRAQRIYIPKGEVTSRGEEVWSSGAITVREYELSAYVDESGFVDYRFILDDDLAL